MLSDSKRNETSAMNVAIRSPLPAAALPQAFRLRASARAAERRLGLALNSPHDLRHRYASVKVKEGVPATELSAQLGHARKSMTLDTYSHVLLAE
jgi:integrase